MSKFVYNGPVMPETELEKIPVLFPDVGVVWMTPNDKGPGDTFIVKEPTTGSLVSCKKEETQTGCVYASDTFFDEISKALMAYNEIKEKASLAIVAAVLSTARDKELLKKRFFLERICDCCGAPLGIFDITTQTEKLGVIKSGKFYSELQEYTSEEAGVTEEVANNCVSKISFGTCRNCITE